MFGNTEGIAPGYEGSLSWKKFERYRAGDYVFNNAGSGDSLFYNRVELSLSPVECIRFAFVLDLPANARGLTTTTWISHRPLPQASRLDGLCVQSGRKPIDAGGGGRPGPEKCELS